jgi:hypothetical protein
MRRVGLIDITVGNVAAPWRIATFDHATLRVAPHRYATREPPGTSRRFSCVWRLMTFLRIVTPLHLFV